MRNGVEHGSGRCEAERFSATRACAYLRAGTLFRFSNSFCELSFQFQRNCPRVLNRTNSHTLLISRVWLGRCRSSGRAVEGFPAALRLEHSGVCAECGVQSRPLFTKQVRQHWVNLANKVVSSMPASGSRCSRSRMRGTSGRRWPECPVRRLVCAA